MPSARHRGPCPARLSRGRRRRRAPPRPPVPPRLPLPARPSGAAPHLPARRGRALLPLRRRSLPLTAPPPASRVSAPGHGGVTAPVTCRGRGAGAGPERWGVWRTRFPPLRSGRVRFCPASPGSRSSSLGGRCGGRAVRAGFRWATRPGPRPSLAGWAEPCPPRDPAVGGAAAGWVRTGGFAPRPRSRFPAEPPPSGPGKARGVAGRLPDGAVAPNWKSVSVPVSPSVPPSTLTSLKPPGATARAITSCSNSYGNVKYLGLSVRNRKNRWKTKTTPLPCCNQGSECSIFDNSRNHNF